MTIDRNFFLVQMIIIVCLIVIVIWFFRVNNSYYIQKRYNRFCLQPFRDNKVPIIDKILNFYYKLIDKVSKIISKSKFITDSSKKYSKYINKSRMRKYLAIDFISIKFIFGILALFPIALSDIVRGVNFTLFKGTLFFLTGFFVPNIYWKYSDKFRKKQIEKDMLKAIIIMNNSFKSGLSIMQAIYMVSNELDGPISEEFRKMYLDISFGLDMDMVFKRFAQRVNTEESHYISTSLSVLNKTGGNIVQVFASVERSAFTRKKLKEELDAMAASSKLIFWILVFLPIVMIVSIVVFQLVFGSGENYFTPLFTTGVGRIILGLIIVIYVTYIYLINKIVNIKE